MPELKNPRHERHVQGLAAGKTSDQAYVDAGFKPDRHNAARLTTKDHIQARLAELQRKAAEKAVVDKAWVLRRLRENVERAMQIEPVLDAKGKPTGVFNYQGSVANQAIKLLGQDMGMFVERKEVGKPGEFDQLTDAEIKRELEREFKALGIDPRVAAQIGRDKSDRVH